MVFGLLTGYLLAGFLLCMIQTLPVQPNFLGFEPYVPGDVAGKEKSSVWRKFCRPDVVWLSMMHRQSDGNRLGER